MNFNKIDVGNWNRNAIFGHFLHEIPCTCSITVKIYITKLLSDTKAEKLRFFPAFLYGLALTVNKTPELRMDFEIDGNAGFYGYCRPCCTASQKTREFFQRYRSDTTPVSKHSASIIQAGPFLRLSRAVVGNEKHIQRFVHTMDKFYRL